MFMKIICLLVTKVSAIFSVKMDESKCTSVIVTNDLRVLICDYQLNTYILIQGANDSCISMDIDKWTEFKQSINTIDEEFKKRFNSQKSDA